jgi:hypothetical protein
MKTLILSLTALASLTIASYADWMFPAKGPRHMRFETVGAFALEDLKLVCLAVDQHDREPIDAMVNTGKLIRLDKGTGAYQEVLGEVSIGTKRVPVAKIKINDTEQEIWVVEFSLMD